MRSLQSAFRILLGIVFIFSAYTKFVGPGFFEITLIDQGLLSSRGQAQHAGQKRQEAKETYRTRCSNYASLPPRSRGSISSGSGQCFLEAAPPWEVHCHPPVLLKGLARQDLREEVRGVVVGRDVLDGHDPSASQLAHLVELAVDVPRVLRAGEAVAEVVRRLAVRAHLDGPRLLVPDECGDG